MEVSYLFAGIGMIILIGFMGSLFFERTKIPDVLILIFLGLFIGPILTQYTSFGLLDDSYMVEMLIEIAPYFAALALVIILFDGGLNLHLEKTMKKMGVALIHTTMVFLGSVAITAVVCYYFIGMDIAIGLLLGAIIGGVSSAVVIPIMMKSSASEDTKILLTLESVLTDVLCIVTALILMEILEGSALNTGGLIQKLLSSFVLAGFIAFLFGVVWLMVLKKLEGKSFAFMITIAALLVLYAVAEFIQVSGAIAALVFGLVLSNQNEIARILKIKGSFVLDSHIKQFHSEVSFLVRTFFFVYLGITFTFSIGTDTFGTLPAYIPPWMAAQPIFVLLALLAMLFTGMFVVRYLSTFVTCAINKESKPDKSYIYTMLPRGLAAAVLAQLPFTIKAFNETTIENGVITPSHYNQLMQPYQNIFLNVAFMIIVLTVVATSIGVSVIERGRANAPPTQQKEVDDWAVKSPTYKRKLEQESKTTWKKKTEPKKWSGPSTMEPAQSQKRQHTPPPQKVSQAPATPPRVVQQARKPVTPAPQKVKQRPAPVREHPLLKRTVASEKATPKKPTEQTGKKKPNK